MVNLESVPFFKVLLPYITGIVLVMHTGLFPQQQLAFGICSCLLFLLFACLRFSGSPYKKLFKTAYLVLVNCFLVLLAYETTSAYTQINDPAHYTHYLKNDAKTPLIGTVEDVPVETEKFLKLPLRVEAICTHKQWRKATGRLIVYAPKGSAIGLHQRLAVNAAFSGIQPPANPYEFDYAAYLKDRNVYHVVFAKEHDLQLLPPARQVSLNALGTYLKSCTIETLRSSGLSRDAFSICSALLVGYDDEIDNSVMNSFSHSGTLHVLSVSGLHTGILYACIMALFGLFDKYGRHKKLKCFVVLVCMLLLMAITGFAPAVCRAVVMLSLILVGKTFFSRGNSFNTLFVSAFLLLLFNPMLVKDLGFLLSYFAVFGIMYLYPLLSALYVPKNKLIKWLLDSTWLSVSATLFTLPLSLYYFHQFPTWFILSNLLIIPISIVIMLAALLLLLVQKVLILKTGIVYAVNALTAFMIRCSQLTDKPGIGYIDLIHFTAMDMAWLCACVIFLFMLIGRKRFVYACCLGITMIAWLLSSAFNVLSGYTQSEIVVFKTKPGNSVLIREGGNLYYAGDSLSPREFDRALKPYLQHTHYARLIMMHHQNYIRLGGQTICLPDHRATAGTVAMLRADTWLIGRQCIKDWSLFNFSGVRRLIATGGNRRAYLVRLEQACALHGIDFHSVYSEGACRIRLD